MEILNKKQKIIIIIIVIFMLLFIGYYIINKANNSGYIELETEENEIIEEIITNEETEEAKQEIVIHVTGEVKKQGIVKVEEGSRISDAIDAAGGITSEADLSKINLAYLVQDGQKINVPNINNEDNLKTIVEDAGENVIEDNSSTSKQEKVNINTASQTELETLNGIGPSTALKVINYREENGKFEKIEDIKNVPGIGDAKFESLKDSICVK